ncbi:hypothetical protein ACFL96_07820 [Thermoproteota archaeon]
MIYPRNGVLLEIEDGSLDEDRLSELVKTVEGVFLTKSFLLTNEISLVKKIEHIIGNKLLFLDLRFEHPLLEDYKPFEVILEDIQSDTITVMGMYGKESILTAFKYIKKNVAAIIDIGTEGYRIDHPDKAVISYAKTARDCGCRSVIMTSCFPERIRKVRHSLGEDFEIISVNSKGNPLDKGRKAGANLEIIPNSVWTTMNTDISSIP